MNEKEDMIMGVIGCDRYEAELLLDYYCGDPILAIQYLKQ